MVNLEPGMERVDEFVVEGRLLTDVGGTLPTSVLSTPGMINMMEECAAALALEGLPDGFATVGFEVCVKHVGAAFEGQSCTAHARLRDDERSGQEGREKIKLRFDVEVRQGDRTIGFGTHERRAVPTRQ